MLIHVEVQAQPNYDLPERMYTYNHRIYDRHRQKVASFAVLADAHFGPVPEPIKAALGAITNEKVLNRLTRKAATAPTLDEFQAELQAAE